MLNAKSSGSVRYSVAAVLSRIWSRWADALVVVKPGTVLRWYRAGFRSVWRWKSRARGPAKADISPEVRQLIGQMAKANPLWGAPKIHGELLKLGINISERSVSRFMPPKLRKPPSQTWRTFLDNHLGSLDSIDFFTVPTATFRILYVFLVLAHERRRVVHFNVTDAPGPHWTAQQMVEAFPEDTAPKPKSYFAYYHRARTHLSLAKDAPEPRAVQPPSMGKIVELPEVGGLHHRYERRAA
jgi:putative transposase